MHAKDESNVAPVVPINTRQRKETPPLPPTWKGAVYSHAGVEQEPATLVITIEERETLMFRLNTIFDCLTKLAEKGYATGWFEAQLAQASILLSQYTEFCPAPADGKTFAALENKSYLVTLAQAKIADELSDRYTDLSRLLSQAADLTAQLDRKGEEIAAVKATAYPRVLRPLKAHAHLHAMASICGFAEKPEVEIERCEKQVSQARAALEAGDVGKAKLHVEAISNIRALGESVQKCLDEKRVIEVFGGI